MQRNLDNQIVLGGVWMGGPFRHFLFGIHVGGCCLVSDDKLQVLAVHTDASEQGKGHFRAFLEFVRSTYSEVTFLELTNHNLESYLIKQGGRRVRVKVTWTTGVEQAKGIQFTAAAPSTT